jgi:hypothetical protein
MTPNAWSRVRATWDALCVSEKITNKRGLDFGRALYDLRDSLKSEVVSGGTTFDRTLSEFSIPHSTAYRWLTRYEEESGKRPKSVQQADDTQADSQLEETTPTHTSQQSSEGSSEKPRKERYQNRGNDSDFEKLRAIALAALSAGFKTVKRRYSSQEWTHARNWAKGRLETAS